MTLVSGSLPNLINGVSQQPDTVRLKTQCEEMVNAWASPVEGLRKRAPTEHIAKIRSTPEPGAIGHSIDRGDGNRFVAVFCPGDVKVYDATTGVQKTINYQERTQTLQDATAGTGNGPSQQCYLPEVTTTLILATSGTFVGTVVWEQSATGAFAGEETTLRTDTGVASGAVSFTTGHYVRSRISAFTSGNITTQVTWESTNYIQENITSTRDDLNLTTVADFTFIANRNQVVQMSGTQEASDQPQAIVWVKNGRQNTDYRIFIEGVERAVYTTATAETDTRTIAEDLRADLQSSIGGSYTITREGSVLHIVHATPGVDFDIRVEDGFGSQGLILVKDNAQKFTDLPKMGFDGFKAKVVGDPEETADDYYVEWDDNDGASSGVWRETRQGGLVNDFDRYTMPHTLVYNASTDDFTYGAELWQDRLVGDTTSLPNPSFVGNKIRAVFFHKNRLGFLADENIILSESGVFFNFWRTTATTLTDSDTIDVAGTHTEVSFLEHAVAWDERLIVVAKNAQFLLDSQGDTLTPETASLPVISTFEVNTAAHPLVLGPNMYFTSDVKNFSQVLEFFVTDSITNNTDASDVTAHVPQYVPKGVFHMAGSTGVSAAFFLSTEASERHKIYAYKYLWGGTRNAEKFQSAWGVWEFLSGEEVLWINVSEGVMDLVISRSDGVFLEQLSLQPKETDDVGYKVLLDRRTELTGVYDAQANLTTWTLPYVEATSVAYSAVLGDTFTTGEPGDVVATTRPSTTTLQAVGNYSEAPCFVGRKFEFKYVFTKIYPRQNLGNGEESIRTGKLTVSTMLLDLDDTGFFKAQVIPDDNPDNYFEYIWSGFVVGQATLGVPNTPDDQYRFKVGGRNTRTTIQLLNDTHMPCAFLQAEWEGNYTTRTRQRI